MTTAIALPGKQELMDAKSLLPVIGMLEKREEIADTEDELAAVTEGFVMVEAVASERRLREQANRAEGGVTRCRAKLGALQTDLRKENPGGDRKTEGSIVPKKEQLISPADRKARSTNKRLGKTIGPEKVAEVVEELVSEGERPTAAKVIKRATGGPVPASGEQEWYTPPHLIESAREVLMTIELDPASSEGAQATVGAKRWYGREQDGLVQPWKGNVWLNPPYSAGVVDRFAYKLLEHVQDGSVREALWLSNASYDTKWGQALCQEATGLCMVAGRVRFIPGSGQAAGAGAWASMVLYFGIYAARFREAFQAHGVVWHKGGVR